MSDDHAARLERLEAELVASRAARTRDRRLLALVVCSALLIAAGEPLKTLTAHRIEVGPRDVPQIVLGEDSRGGSIVLHDRDGHTATLTARGLSFEEPPPVATPTLKDPGLADAHRVDTSHARVFVNGTANTVEVACATIGFRERTRIVGGLAMVEVPTDARCVGYVKGGSFIGRFGLEPGHDYLCDLAQQPSCKSTGVYEPE